MARLTVTLTNERHRALKEAAARRNKSIGQLIEESLEFYGIKSTESAAELVTAARHRAGLRKADAVALACKETQAERRG